MVSASAVPAHSAVAVVPMAVMSTNPAIRLVSKLIKIVLLAVAFAVSQNEAEIMQKSVEEFLTDLRKLLPSFRLTAKFHYMLHYREQILRHGPLRHLWSMRFEAKHQTLKRTLSTSKNRKNLPKSMGNRITPVGDILALLCDSARLKSTEL